MAIMAMATAGKINKFHFANVMALLSYFIISSSTTAGEWRFAPNFGLEETYSDNVELTLIEPTSSLVSQAIIGLNADYQSRVASLTFSGTNSNVFYSHDSDLNDNYLTLGTTGQYYLWTSGPEIFASATVDNTNRNSASNGLADLVSGDTVQSEYYSTGIRYNTNNSTFTVESSLTFDATRYEDNIGENNGVSAILNTSSGNNARIAFWQFSSGFSTNSQDFSGETRTGEQYQIDAQFGLILPFNWTPFVRFYDEDFSGDLINQNQQTTGSWGPGIRWQVSPHFKVDFSYNYVFDETVSDDYAAAAIAWEPSARTSLAASYSQRFFGDSYSFDFEHRTKRFTNTISYDESLEVFDRNSYEQVDAGIFWCPPDITIERVSQCFVQSDQSSSNLFQLIRLFSLEPVESDEFSLYRRFVWGSKLQLSRTSFAINANASRREGMESKVIDDTLGASFTIDRRISGKSKLTLLAKYDYLIFDKSNPEGSRQEDYYRTLSATYTKDLASSLSTHFTIQHINRDSNIDRYSYDEMRAIFNVTKEF